MKKRYTIPTIVISALLGILFLPVIASNLYCDFLGDSCTSRIIGVGPVGAYFTGEGGTKEECYVAKDDGTLEPCSIDIVQINWPFPSSIPKQHECNEMCPDEIVEINRQAVIHQNNNDEEKFNEQTIRMQEKMTYLARDSWGLNVYMSDVFQAYFPLIEGSEIKIPNGVESFEICNVAENIPLHLQNIKKTERFQLFAEKYSDYPIELFLQDERRNNSSFHYGLIAKSDDGRTALTFFHANSCTNQITDSERYFLSCHNDAKHHVFSTINKEDIIASLNHPDFCTIPLDSWRQSVYDYNQKIKEQLEEHLPTIETINKSHESVSAYESESRRLAMLSDISGMYVMAVDDEQDIEEKVRQYNNLFGPLPVELLQILETRK